MFTYSQFLSDLTNSAARSAFRLYFEPILWIRETVRWALAKKIIKSIIKAWSLRPLTAIVMVLSILFIFSGYLRGMLDVGTIIRIIREDFNAITFGVIIGVIIMFLDGIIHPWLSKRMKR